MRLNSAVIFVDSVDEFRTFVDRHRAFAYLYLCKCVLECAHNYENMYLVQ